MTTTQATGRQLKTPIQIGTPGSNYTGIAADGTITLAGDARVNKEYRIPAYRAKAGASAPNETTRQIGTSASMLTPVEQFSKTIQQDLHFSVHGDYDIDNSVNVTFHMLWIPGAAWTAGNYMWKLEYIVKAEDADSTTGGATTIPADVTPGDAVTMIETEFADTINLDAEQILYCHFYRDVANDNGDDTGDVIMFEIEYTANKLGE